MYRKQNPDQLYLDDFKLQFGGRLRKDNRWVRKSKMIPWDQIETEYARNFTEETGVPAINARIAYGALYIKESEELTDRETVEYIMENPYAQYFLGLSEFTEEPLFDASMMVHFRKRFPTEGINGINRMMFEQEVEKQHKKEKDDEDDGPTPPSAGGAGGEAGAKPKNKGTLILDGSCAPADIRYPSDLSLLNEARENLEEIINELWQHSDRQGHKTGYQRKKARNEYLAMAKQKKPRNKKLHKTIGLQLTYIKKNIDTIGRLLLQTGMEILSEKRISRIMTICELYRQQRQMHKNRNHECADRIVSLRQPHIRPIVRGKQGKRYEFGQKIAISVINGYTFIEKQSYDNFNEGISLKDSAEQYKTRYGCYPEAILADTIYRNRDNLRYCKDHGIRLSGPPLGRPKKNPSQAEKDQARQDNKDRNIVEGRLGIAKRRYGLDLIMSYLPETGLTEASMQIFCMNLEHLYRQRFFYIFLFVLYRFLAVFRKKLIACDA